MLAEVKPLKAKLHQNFILVGNFFFLAYFVLCPALLNYSLIVKYRRGNTKDLWKVFATGSQKATQQLTMNWHAWALKGFQKQRHCSRQAPCLVDSSTGCHISAAGFFSVPHFESRIQLTGFGEHIAAENGFSSHSTCTNNILFGRYDKYAATESFTKLTAQEVLPMGKQHLTSFFADFCNACTYGCRKDMQLSYKHT